MNTTTIIIDESNLIARVNFINKMFTQYVMGIVLIVGNIGSILDGLVFSQSILRKSSFSLYFIACSIGQFFTFNFALLTRILHFGYDIRPMNYLLWFCKFRQYLVYPLVAIPRYFIILASIDRYFASSRETHRRQWSSRRIAFRLIIANILFWFLIYIHVPIFFTNITGQCIAPKGAYDLFFSIHLCIDSGILPLFLICMFGWLTLKHIRQMKRRVTMIVDGGTVRHNFTAGLSKNDMQLVKILVNQVGFFIIFNMPLPCYLLYQTFTLNSNKSPLRLTVESCLGNIIHCSVYIEFALTFFINIMTSHLFQSELQRFLHVKLSCQHTRVHPIGTVRGTTKVHSRK